MRCGAVLCLDVLLLSICSAISSQYAKSAIDETERTYEERTQFARAVVMLSRFAPTHYSALVFSFVFEGLVRRSFEQTTAMSPVKVIEAAVSSLVSVKPIAGRAWKRFYVRRM